MIPRPKLDGYSDDEWQTLERARSASASIRLRRLGNFPPLAEFAQLVCDALPQEAMPALATYFKAAAAGINPIDLSERAKEP